MRRAWQTARMHITALAGGVGGARFLRGLLAHLNVRPSTTTSDLRKHSPTTLLDPPGAGAHAGGETVAAAGTGATGPARLTVIGNTGDDITLFGLRVCPDLDTLLYTLGGGVSETQGWGRADETYVVQEELAAYGVAPQWFRLGDQDMATHIARSQWLGLGLRLSDVTERLAERWGLPQRGVTLLPMSDDPVETHVVIDDGGQARAIHFQEWWVRHHAAIPAQRFVGVGLEHAAAAPGVCEAIRDADVILLPPSNPVVSIGVILSVPGVREALRETSAPVIGVAPLIGGAPVRGYADACLAALGLPSTAAAVAGLYADFLDGWLVAPGDVDQGPWPEGVVVRGRPLLMSDAGAAADLAGAAVDLALELRGATGGRQR
jgi:LPPG:FO 2-phospho-L-lactate transferase